MKTKLFFTIMLSCSIIFGSAQIIHVPADQPTIQAGINAASPGDTILVAEGTYYENIRFKGKAITVASNYIMDTNTSHISNTIIDGSQALDPDTAAVVMFINGETTNSVLHGFTITGGTGVLSELYNIRKGGGIFCNNAGATIEYNRITQNHLSHDVKAGGAGIDCQRDAGDHLIIIRDNVIDFNSCTSNGVAAYGGGIHATINTIIENNIIENNICENTGSGWADGGAFEIEQYPGYSITTKITNNVIRYNSISGYDCIGGGIVVLYAEANIAENTVKFNTIDAEHNGNGGGIWMDSPLADVKMLDNDISENIINAGNYGRGGGVCFWNPRSKLTITNNIVNNNETNAVECRGTGILLRCNQYPVGKIEVRKNEFIGNLGNTSALNCHGGAVCINDAWDTLVIIDGNRFEGNTAIKGGGLFSRRSYNLKLTNNFFINNNASNAGGGVRLYHVVSDKKSSMAPMIINNTFCNNSSGYGGAISLVCETSVPVIFNNVFRDNQAAIYDNIYYDISGTDSIILSYNNIDLSQVYGLWTGTENIDVDPFFVDPSIGNFHIADDSPCASKGTDVLSVLGLDCCCPDHDFDGDPRPLPFTAMPDIGADEVDEYTGVDALSVEGLALKVRCFPNPLTTSTTIQFTLPINDHINLEICDITGRKVKTLYSGNLQQGDHSFVWEANGMKEGIYLLRLEMDGVSESRKLLLVK